MRLASQQLAEFGCGTTKNGSDEQQDRTDGGYVDAARRRYFDFPCNSINPPGQLQGLGIESLLSLLLGLQNSYVRPTLRDFHLLDDVLQMPQSPFDGLVSSGAMR